MRTGNDYRLGQAIWNILAEDYKELTDHYLATGKDFFYWTDNQKVIACFFEYYVSDFGHEIRSKDNSIGNLVGVEEVSKNNLK